METVKDSDRALDLFKEAIAKAREHTPASREAGHAVRVKLAVDLNEQHLQEIPSRVADLLKEDVER